jgi:hypothetical protein
MFSNSLFVCCLHSACTHARTTVTASFHLWVERNGFVVRGERREEKRGRSVRESLVPTPMVFRASTAVLNRLCDPGKIFLTSNPRLVIYFFLTRHIKLKLRPELNGRLLIANHLDQVLWLANQKQGAAVRSYLLHSSLADLAGVRGFAVPFTSLSKLCKTLNVFAEHLERFSVCDPCKILSRPPLVIYSFLTAPIKLMLGTANRWETTNNKPPGSSIMIGQSETGSSS